MSWNYRLVKEKTDDGVDWFGVHEVFYNNDGSIHLMSEEPVSICGETPEEIKETCQKIIDCLEKQMLIDGEIVFVDSLHSSRLDTAQQSVQRTGQVCSCGDDATMNIITGLCARCGLPRR